MFGWEGWYGVTGGTYEGEDLGEAPEGEEESEEHCEWFVVVKEGGGLMIGGVVVVVSQRRCLRRWNRL